MKYDVIALGELLIDFIQNEVSSQGNPLLEANPGGAPCNVLSMLQKLDKKTAFIGKVGNDGFGRFLKGKIEEQGIDSSYLKMDDEIHTTLAIVTKDKTGDRSFAFYRKPGADINLKINDLSEELFKEARLFHFGTLSFTDEPILSTSKRALELAKENKMIISFDPNLRESLWDSLEEAKCYTDYGLKYADVLKISDNEINWFTGIEDYDEAAEYLLNKYPNIKLLTVTLGKNGSMAFLNGMKAKQKAFLNKGYLETTGCGDTFMACVISYALDYGFDMNQQKLEEMLEFASGASSLVSTRNGALVVMPSKDEVLEHLKKFK